MPTDEELLQRRTDQFQAWWETKSADWGLGDQDDRDLAWALCREAWYAGRALA